jgi:O-antigen ligase
MSRKKRKAELPAASAPPARDPGGAIAAAALLMAIVCAGLAVDSGADAAFDAPKRLTTLAAIGIAALAAFGFSRWAAPLSSAPAGRFRLPFAAWMLFAFGCAAALASALSSPHRAAALDATRALLLTALLLPLGASRVLEKHKALLLTAFLVVAAVDTSVSVLQARNIYRPFALISPGSRETTGAFVGNPGSLALALALAAVSCLGVLLWSGRTGARAAAGLGALVFVSGLLVNRNLTSWTALVAGAVLLLVCRYGRRAAPAIALLLLLAGVGVVLYRPLRQRVRETVSALRDRDWDRLVTYRLGAWSAAAAMAGERPWTGFGPGTFGAEFVPHRLRAEIALRRRLVNPLVTASYGEAHCDYLQAFAETGIPAGLAALGAVALLFRGLRKKVRTPGPRQERAEAVLLLAFLGAGAVAALTWFPLQRPISAVPLLLAAGRAWKISESDAVPSPVPPEPRTPNTGHRLVRILRGLLLAGILAWALAPEIPRYRAERVLRPAADSLRYLVSHPGEISDPPKVLDHIQEFALTAAPGLPGDSRPLVLAGSCRLVGADPAGAIDFYRKALGLGERAEIDLNLGRAYEAGGETEKAAAAFLRAVWISPALFPALLPDLQPALRERTGELEKQLRKGRLTAPPPLP